MDIMLAFNPLFSNNHLAQAFRICLYLLNIQEMNVPFSLFKVTKIFEIKNPPKIDGF
tara:strand:+ start:507 stop:677 length:171 start_codon:yes stop_codon:yes gene_type:complete